MFSYVAYGLGISSTLRMPELVASDMPADVIIRRGKVRRLDSEKTMSGYSFRLTRNEAYLHFPEVGTLLIRGGREIVIDSDLNVDEDALRLYILGPALAHILRFRGFFPLHASAVRMNGLAVLFLGPSGQGKSTTAATLCSRGHELIADDMTAVRIDSGVVQIIPGFSQLKLWPDAALSLGHALHSLPKVHSGHKKHALRSTHFQAMPCPLSRAYVLAEGPSPKINILRGQEAVLTLVRHSFILRSLQGSDKAAHLLRCQEFARHMNIRRLERPRSLESLPEVIRLVEEDLGLDPATAGSGATPKDMRRASATAGSGVIPKDIGRAPTGSAHHLAHE